MTPVDCFGAVTIRFAEMCALQQQDIGFYLSQGLTSCGDDPLERPTDHAPD